MGLRLAIGFVVSLILWFAGLVCLHVPKDRFMPPALSYNGLNKTTTGYIVSVGESPFGDHWWDGNTDTEYYEEYKFTPSIMTTMPDGTEKLIPSTQWQTGRVPIARNQYEDKTSNVSGTAVEVTYDPYNPVINGLTGTGKINMGAGFLSGWLWYVLGLIASTIAIGEIMKKWIVPAT